MADSPGSPPRKKALIQPTLFGTIQKPSKLGRLLACKRSAPEDKSCGQQSEYSR